MCGGNTSSFLSGLLISGPFISRPFLSITVLSEPFILGPNLRFVLSGWNRSGLESAIWNRAQNCSDYFCYVNVLINKPHTVTHKNAPFYRSQHTINNHPKHTVAVTNTVGRAKVVICVICWLVSSFYSFDYDVAKIDISIRKWNIYFFS